MVAFHIMASKKIILLKHRKATPFLIKTNAVGVIIFRSTASMISLQEEGSLKFGMTTLTHIHYININKVH